MTIEEKSDLRDYIIKKLESLPNLKFSQEQITNVINQYSNQNGTLDEIKKSIDKRIDKFISDKMKQELEINKLKDQLGQSTKENPFFGEVYKTYVIHIFSIYEEIINSNLPEEDKKEKFTTRLYDYLSENGIEMNNLLVRQIRDERLINLAATELYRGADSLNFDSVKNLYNTFIEELNIISNDFEGKMYCTVPNNQQIFQEPILNENNEVCINPNIKYNFSMIKETYDFAKKHGKKVKFHTFLWHNAVPENLKKEIEMIVDPLLRRKMALAFLENYASSLSNFMKENDYDLRQFEALNEISSDEPGESVLRDSWWKDIIGKNPENGDEYFIDVLKIVKKKFPDTEIIYNEYNEFIRDKTDRICNIIEQIKHAEQRDGATLLDGIGLQAHYSDYIPGFNRPLTEKDIIESAVKLQKACDGKKIYITEFDFLDFQKDGSKEKLEQAFIEAYSKVANGFIMWGNSDSLTWYHCVDKDGNSMNAQIIDSRGNPKEIYEQYRKAFFIDKDKEQKNCAISLQEIGRGTVESFKQNPKRAMKAMDSLEYGVRKQEELKEGQTQKEG